MKKKLIIVGGGPCALILGCFLDPVKFEVSIFERNAALGRKFLVAGHGGLNITHSEDPSAFIERYTPNEFLKEAFRSFNNRDLVQWLKELGITTFTGSSGRIFPDRRFKPAEVLQRMNDTLIKRKVAVHFQHLWTGFHEKGMRFHCKGEDKYIHYDIAVFCLGGASWPVTGSDGSWTGPFKGKNISILPFQPSNCTFLVNWNRTYAKQFAGKALKNIELFCENRMIRGEITVTEQGVEGSGIYPFSPLIRAQLKKKGEALVALDLKPGLTKERITALLQQTMNRSKVLKEKIKLSDTAFQLVRSHCTKEDFLDNGKLTALIKHFPLTITACGSIDDAISTTGGISLDEIDRNFMLKKLPGHYCIGEMLDYDAPTGGYLLQSCFSMGKYLAAHLNRS